jgi:hypothetical protein
MRAMKAIALVGVLFILGSLFSAEEYERAERAALQKAKIASIRKTEKAVVAETAKEVRVEDLQGLWIADRQNKANRRNKSASPNPFYFDGRSITFWVLGLKAWRKAWRFGEWDYYHRLFAKLENSELHCSVRPDLGRKGWKYAATLRNGVFVVRWSRVELVSYIDTNEKTYEEEWVMCRRDKERIMSGYDLSHYYVGYFDDRPVRIDCNEEVMSNRPHMEENK